MIPLAPLRTPDDADTANRDSFLTPIQRHAGCSHR